MLRQSKLEALVEPVVQSMGCELWGLDFSGHGKGSSLRIFIEKKDGVSIEDCERVSRQVSSVFDVEDPIHGEYTLEVSSPGMDRNLYKPEHYKEYAGQKIQLRLRVPFEGRRKFSGLLAGVEDSEIIMQVDNEEYLLPFELIDRAKVVPSY